ncbi:hypothetical protein FPC831_1940003 [Flavobacterium psychrophilum]|nr:hypothetical protein FPC831_1940003 [Flavobacterium psychrophilum]
MCYTAISSENIHHIVVVLDPLVFLYALSYILKTEHKLILQ